MINMINGHGLQLGWYRPLGAPVLNGFASDIADPLGGDTIYVYGVSLGGGSVTVNGVSATVLSSIDGILAFTAPANAVGLYDVVVTTSLGISNAIQLEYWSPATESGCTAFAEKPNYAVTGRNGSWTMRVGATAFAHTTAAPAAVAGAPSFNAAQSDRLNGAVYGNLFGTTNGGAMSFVTSLSSPGGPNNVSPFAERGIMSDDSFGALGCGYSTAGFRVYLTDGAWKYSVTPCPTDGTQHAMVGRFKNSDVIQSSVDGSSFAGSTAVGTRNAGNAAIQSRLGVNFGATYMTGEMRAVVCHNTKVSDGYAVKFYKWAKSRHGVA